MVFDRIRRALSAHEEGPEDVDTDKQIYKAEQEMQQARQDIQRSQNEYLGELQEGANAPPGRRRVHAIRARIAKFKANIHKLRELKAIHALTQAEVAKGVGEARTVLREAEETADASEVLRGDPDELADRVRDAEAQLASQFKQMEDMMGGLEVGETGDMGVETTEEEALMEELARGETDIDDVDVDVGPDADADHAARRDLA